MAALVMIIMKNVNLTLMMAMLIILYNASMQSTLNSKISYFFTSDLVSYWITNMTIMTFFILALLKQSKPNTYKVLMTTMTMALIMTFNNWNFTMFYILFEVSLVIILVIIITWGYQPERTEAMMFMITMTLMFSLPFMLAMMIKAKTMNFWFLEINKQILTFASFLFIFMMKMPIYFTHFWLPKAHVEAPVHGSMILAAILLKLGCYGMMRMNNLILKFNNMKPTIIAVTMMSMIILSVNCIMQMDMKTLIAYSSIVHMTMVFTNILIMKYKSMYSSMLIILGHGLCAAAMFFMANTMYVNSKSRSILLNKGILTIMPAMPLMWFVTCMNNAPMPPSMNMMGELISFKNMVSWSKMMYTPIVLAALTSSMYSIYLFCPPSHGPISKMTNSIKMNTTNSNIMMIMMLAPITTLTVKPAMMML